MGWFTKRELVLQTPERLRAAREANEQAERVQRQAKFEKWFHGKLIPSADAALAESAGANTGQSEWHLKTYGPTTISLYTTWRERPGIRVFTFDEYVAARIAPHYKALGYEVEASQKRNDHYEKDFSKVIISY